MKYLSTLVLVIAFATNITAQQFHFGAGYNYTYSHQWDKAIQTYNFARPDLVNKQPLLIHGYYANAALLFHDTARTAGIAVAYRYTRSAAKNENFNTVLNLHLVSIGYLLHYEKPLATHSIYLEGKLSVLLGGIFRSVNGEALVDDGKPVRALGLGGEIALSGGYRFALNQRVALSPFVQVCYSPYYYSWASEAMLNQTIGLTGRQWTMILGGQVGVNICFTKS